MNPKIQIQNPSQAPPPSNLTLDPCFRRSLIAIYYQKGLMRDIPLVYIRGVNIGKCKGEEKALFAFFEISRKGLFQHLRDRFAFF